MTYKSIFNAKVFILATLLLVASTTAHAQAGASHDQQIAAKKSNLAAAAGATNPVGSGTAGQITKWIGLSGNTPAIGDSGITEDKFGKIGIGTTSPTSTLTVKGTIETTLGGYKFPDGTVQTSAFDPNQVVRSLSGLRGDLILAAGANITVTSSGGNTLTVAAPNALTSVSHDATLAGNGTGASPLGIANAGVGTNQLANDAVIAAKIAPANVVKSINGLQDGVTFVAGSNITLTPVGNTLTIASTGADPDQNAFQRTIDLSIPDGSLSKKTVAVPSGKRMVIEYLSIKVFGDSADFQPMVIAATVGGVNSQHFIQMPLDTSSFGNALDKLVHIISDSDIEFTVIERAGPGAEVIVTISGHLVDLP